MTKNEREAYEKELLRVAKKLRLPKGGNVEETIVHHFEDQLESWITEHGQPATLTELVDLLSASLGMSFEEIRSDADLEHLLERFPPQKELVMARLAAELDENTDAVTIHRSNHKPWERPFLAVINCRGRHNSRRFFSKWHETVHRLVEGDQLKFAFRRTPVEELRKDPHEVLIDRIAAALAFYPSLFKPVFLQEYGRSDRLNFSVIDRIREIIAPDASRQTTMIACIKACPTPVWCVRCGVRYKKGELLLTSPGSSPRPKLRVLEVAASPAALELGIHIHSNMRVPVSSIVAQAFRNPEKSTHSGIEKLEIWETSSDGPIGFGTIEVEAVRSEDGVSAFIHLLQSSGNNDEGTPGVATVVAS